MTQVGVRDLRQHASELLRRVQAGETIEVTERGKPVALLTPVPDAGELAQLRARGETIPAQGTLDDLPDPLPVPPSQEPPSAVLARLREHER